MRSAMIMAGGSGTRLWPMSRRALPKQLLPIVGGRSLLEIAADRLEGVVPAERRLICTGEAYRSIIESRLPAFAGDRILGEPVGRDTVNAVGFTAAVLHATDPDAVFAVLTADHVIEPQDEFRARLETGFALVEDDPSRMVTFAITATFPATGYGYVRRGDPIAGFDGAYRAEAFVEKPDRATAERYVAERTYGWNSGMFVFHAGTVLEALERFLPEAHAGLTRIGAAWNGPRRDAVLAETYPTLPKVSVDYALMEPAAADDALTVCCVPMAVSWTDVGSWTAYGDLLDPDDDGHRTNARTLHHDSSNVLAISDDPDHLIATIGCSDLVVVRTKDATLVVPRDRVQDVKTLAEQAADGDR